MCRCARPRLGDPSNLRGDRAVVTPLLLQEKKDGELVRAAARPSQRPRIDGGDAECGMVEGGKGGEVTLEQGRGEIGRKIAPGVLD